MTLRSTSSGSSAKNNTAFIARRARGPYQLTEPAAGVGTRNFVKATIDGNTGFALDPVSRQELATGHLASRETTISIHHR